MTVAATTSTPTASAATAAPADARTSLATNFNTFLTLLTAQMKNQDPLSPMDSTQFTQQLTQMTGVEQQLQTNDLLKQLVGNTSSGISAAVSLIGKNVRAASDAANLVNGQGKWTYKLDRAASDVKLEVLDANGKVVAAQAPTDNAIGDHDFTWDGKGPTGSKLPDGVYTLRVTATDTAGVTVPSTTYVQGIVTAVEQAGGSTQITINGGKVAWDHVTAISQPAATTTANNTDSQTPSTPAA
ncbi:flagellar hook assembly protein FlgD [Phenylobacterium hankyongense]|uniref:Basal-body rod modification protein FlgD n=1 Tax=Phenylobacterium hankyongense TaxID=1813876 RepID=A0A328B1Z1_9CAUL|nr:flagellar hook assembly protein FlgD [Phenylobacterium hankyongense]RAK60471.1 flagellar hook assembly protein FlgD [Phenylobacterium hankyongense]